MNNFQMLTKRCHEDFLILKNPVYMRVFSVFDIIPTPKYKTDFNCFCLGILTRCALIWYRLSHFYEVFLLLLSNSYHLDAITQIT